MISNAVVGSNHWPKLVPTIWRPFDESVFVPRCGRCGRYRPTNELFEHWFFRGVYCLPCIQGVLYDDLRNVSEVEK